ncbi:LysE family transporter [Aquincola tertiaricarbonis]|uniref:LysE family transporter n=1 Tax=Aquincola tertiaricarbonis TaxID=391953 RepID=A0ABY4SGF6_AQUTE|nr:LysE family transporter [Aquincola tertiaricarbonis]URI10289.1 LysE family transporter [Aquincola tertiaricarbonis]
MALSVWLTFLLAAFAISLSPGTAAIAAMSTGSRLGLRGGWRLMPGLALGITTQMTVVALGLGALIVASATAFMVVKWLGVAYLAWLGLQQWRAPAVPMAAATEAAAAERRGLLLRGWMINALNPKGTVFMLAVVPQFLDLSLPLPLQYAVITATLCFTEMLVMTGYMTLAARVLGLLRTPRQMGWLNRSFGGLFMAAAALLATFKRAV